MPKNRKHRKLRTRQERVKKRRAKRNRPKRLGRTVSFKSIGNVGQHKMVSYRVGS